MSLEGESAQSSAERLQKIIDKVRQLRINISSNFDDPGNNLLLYRVKITKAMERVAEEAEKVKSIVTSATGDRNRARILLASLQGTSTAPTQLQACNNELEERNQELEQSIREKDAQIAKLVAENEYWKAKAGIGKDSSCPYLSVVQASSEGPSSGKQEYPPGVSLFPIKPPDLVTEDDEHEWGILVGQYIELFKYIPGQETVLHDLAVKSNKDCVTARGRGLLGGKEHGAETRSQRQCCSLEHADPPICVFLARPDVVEGDLHIYQAIVRR